MLTIHYLLQKQKQQAQSQNRINLIYPVFKFTPTFTSQIVFNKKYFKLFKFLVSIEFIIIFSYET